MIIVNTGNGKGKTTAALGAALRAVGEGKRVLMIQFIKGPWKSGEDIFVTGNKQQATSSAETDSPLLRALNNFELRKMGKGFVGILGDKLPREEHEKAAEAALEMARDEIIKGIWDMLILDEVNNALHLNLIKKESLLELLDMLPVACHLVLTGRDAHPDVMARADLVTEMQEVKHPLQEGIKGKRGIEY